MEESENEVDIQAVFNNLFELMKHVGRYNSLDKSGKDKLEGQLLSIDISKINSDLKSGVVDILASIVPDLLPKISEHLSKEVNENYENVNYDERVNLHNRFEQLTSFINSMDDSNEAIKNAVNEAKENIEGVRDIVGEKVKKSVKERLRSHSVPVRKKRLSVGEKVKKRHSWTQLSKHEQIQMNISKKINGVKESLVKGKPLNKVGKEIDSLEGNIRSFDKKYKTGKDSVGSHDVVVGKFNESLSKIKEDFQLKLEEDQSLQKK